MRQALAQEREIADLGQWPGTTIGIGRTRSPRKAMMTRSATSGNRLLAILPAADLNLLTPDFENVVLDQDAVLLRTGDPVGHVFFPHSCAVSLMVEMANGQTVATAVVGREGVIGSLSVLGPSPSAITSIVHIKGTASRISASRFYVAFNSSNAIRTAVQIHIRAMLVQLQFGAACSALHPVSARMVRWMLHLLDNIDDDILPVTQEGLAQMLGVRRTTVTLLMRNLRASKAIKSDRRGHIEIDRTRLAGMACECHATIRRELEQIFAMDPQ